MLLQKIEIVQFRCFKHVELDFGNQNGFFLLTGENKDNPNLGANGIGKTTLFDAVTWCLFEKTAKGLKAGKLLNRNAKDVGYSVTLKFDTFTVKRSWKPNELLINGKVADDSQLGDLIKMSFEQFLQCVYFHQGGEHFIDKTPKEKLDFLSDVFQLDRWTRVADHAKEKVKVLKHQIEVDEAVHVRIEDEVNHGLNNVLSLQQQDTKWQEDEKNFTKETEEKIQITTQSKNDWDAMKLTKIADLQKKQTEMENSASVEDQPDTTAKELADIDSKIKSLGLDRLINFAKEQEMQMMQIKTQAQIKADAIKEMQDPAFTKCRSCGQTIDKGNVQEHCQKLVAEIQELVLKNQELDTTLQATNKSIQDIQSTIDELTKEKERVITSNANNRVSAEVRRQQQALIASVRNELQEVQNSVNPFDKVLEDLQQNLSVRPANPFKAMIQETAQRVQEKQKEREELLQKITQQKSQQADMDFWAKKFPLVRLAILGDISTDLQIYFNQALANIGLDHWLIEVETDKKLADGDRIRKELVLKVSCGGTEIDPDTLSGGEKQRLRIATAIGISNMIKARLNSPWSQLFVDEPTIGLSTEGVEWVINFFGDISKNSQVFFADHRMMGLDKFDRVINVVKHADGNSTISETRQLTMEQLTPVG